MKKLLLFAVVLAVFLTLFNSCNTINQEILNNENASETQVVLPDVEYEIYYDDKWADAAVYEGELPLKTNFEDIDFYKEINVTEIAEEYTDETAQNQRSLTIDGKIYNVGYVNSVQLSHPFKKNGEEAIIVDNYTNENVKIGIYRKTGELYSFRDNTALTEEGEFNVEKAREKSEKIIKEIYGEGMLLKYVYNDGYLFSQDQTLVTVYRRTVFDCPTDESITFRFKMNGELASIVSGGTRGMFDEAERSLISEELVRANNFIVDLYAKKGWTLGERRLAVRNNGAYYLEADLSIPEEQCSRGQKSYGVYINIK